MANKSAAMVGLFVIIGSVALWYGFRFLSHSRGETYALYADFTNGAGIARGAIVRINGVNVGEVGAIELMGASLVPRAKFVIDAKYRDKIPDDSALRVSSGLLVTTSTIDISVGSSSRMLGDGDSFKLVRSPGTSTLAQFAPEAETALRELTQTVKELRPLLAGTTQQLQGILKRADGALANVESATGTMRDIVSDPKIRSTMRRSLDNLDMITADMRNTTVAMSAELKGVAKRNSGKVDELVNGAVDLLQRFTDTVDAARGTLTKLTEQVSDPRLQQSLIETVDLARATLARFNQIASDIHGLTGDPTVQNDLKSSVTSIKDAAEQGQRLMANVGSLVERFKPAAAPKLGIATPQPSIDFIGRGHRPGFRSDLFVKFPIGENAVTLGLYDFAETNSLVAQYHTPVAGLGDIRYGIYGARLGVGVDTKLRKNLTAKLDIFNPNRLNVDLRGLYKINNDFSFWFGAENIFREPTPIIGVRLTR